MLEEKTNLRSKDIKGTETYGKRPATMNQTHQVIGTCAAHISWNLRSRDSEVESSCSFMYRIQGVEHSRTTIIEGDEGFCAVVEVVE